MKEEQKCKGNIEEGLRFLPVVVSCLGLIKVLFWLYEAPWCFSAEKACSRC